MLQQVSSSGFFFWKLKFSQIRQWLWTKYILLTGKSNKESSLINYFSPQSLKGNYWVGKCVKIPLFPSVNDGEFRPKWAFTTCRQVQVHKMEFGHSRNLRTFKIVDELLDFKNFQCLLLFVSANQQSWECDKLIG